MTEMRLTAPTRNCRNISAAIAVRSNFKFTWENKQSLIFAARFERLLLNRTFLGSHRPFSFFDSLRFVAAVRRF
jgi:hypothetical protein